MSLSALETSLRRKLENAIIQARDVAETAARSALQKRAVHEAKPYPHFKEVDRKLRNRLRARGKQAGDTREKNDMQSIDQLGQELAYEFWHRMLFARFLAENHLLMHPDGVALSLEECEELAKDADPPAPNGFVMAARYASTMLPQIFRTDDVLLEIDFAPEQRLALEKELSKLPRETFLADDSLGWVYQFWQSKKKDQVNKSGDKIDSHTLSAVTQLFTEHYMVQFLLHNTLGAWWCAKEGISGQGAGVNPADCPVALEYLRWREDGTPAAGKFEGWPKTLKEFTLLDPCCGSGHFLVAAFNLLVPLRMHDEGLSARDACDAVLRENLFGLELDPRCTQIAAFALAVAAWKYPDKAGQPLGYRELPPLNIACTGIGPQATEEEWLDLAEQSGHKMTVLSRDPILNGLRNLHALFSDAPTLGSLIDPNQLSATLISADYETLLPYLSAALTAEQSDDDAHERAVAAAGMVKAAELLAGEYTLVVTNVPYLGRGKQDDILRKHLEQHFPHSKADLATAFIERCLEFCAKHGTIALVTPQNWLFLSTYQKLRKQVHTRRTWNMVARLGPNAFQDMNFWAATTALEIVTAQTPSEGWEIAGIDVSDVKDQRRKAARLADREPTPLQLVRQSQQLRNPDSRIELNCPSELKLLEEFADAYRGQGSGDTNRFICCFWEITCGSRLPWIPLATSSEMTMHYGGCTQALLWEEGEGQLAHFQEELAASKMPKDGWKRGWPAWGKLSVRVTPMSDFPSSLHEGSHFDSNCAVIVPKEQKHLMLIWCFCSSPEYKAAVRGADQSPKVTSANLVKIPFDFERWQKIAASRYPNGVPEPHSNDPTQWLFKGDIAASAAPLQVAVVRLLGFHWPEQPKSDDVAAPHVDNDGIVCLPGVRAEFPAAERLTELMHVAHGESWTHVLQHKLLMDATRIPGTTLDNWLRDAFFEQHCKLFHNRPFIWHIWDGRKDGFACLVNYHRLNHKTLENLTYSYLQDWITAQAAQAKSGTTGADLRLAAAQALQDKLKLILAGEPPYDIFVRWKPLHEQAIGWNPDLNDGVRMNIRPFIKANILRKTPNIKWTKDRGKEPQRDQADYPWFWNGNEFTGDRVNDIHLTNADKMAARAIQKGATT